MSPSPSGRAVVDLGMGHTMRFTTWAPDRVLNPQYADLPDMDPVGGIHTCRHGNQGSILFRSEVIDKVYPNHPVWELVSLDPLHLEPSIVVHRCGCHGFIRDGKWADA